MKTSTRLALLLSTALLVLAVACGGDSDDADAETASPTSTVESSTETATPRHDDGGGDGDDDRNDGPSDRNSDGGSADDVRRDVIAMLEAAFGEELDVATFAEHFPEECPADLGELALGLAFAQAFLGEESVEFEVTDIEFIDDDRALVMVAGSGGLFDLADSLPSEESPELFVLQDGVWRSTSDCAAFDEEREALGLSTTTSDDGDLDGDFSFGPEFGPPVAASVGQALPVGELVVTITGASLSSEAPDAFSDPPQGVYVVVDFTFANDGQEPTSPWWALDMQLFDDQDRTWDHAGLPFDDVGPGFSGEFQVAWDVPPGATGFRVIVSADAFVDLPLPDDFAPWEVPLGDIE